MPVIFLNRYFHPDHSATSQMLSELAFGLAAAGQDVRIVTSRQRYDDPAGALPAVETVAGVRVHRVATTRFGRARLPGRALDYLTFYLASAWRLWRIARPGDVVVAKTDPPLLSVVAAPVARLRGARLVNWLQDVFPEVAEALGVGGRAGRPLFSALRRLRNRSLRAAQVNVVLGARMAETLRRQGVAGGRIRIVPNWADGTLITPIAPADNPLRAAWGLDGRFVVGYSGNLGRAHDLDTLTGAMVRVQASPPGADIPQVMFLFIGGGAKSGALQAEVARRRLVNVRFEPYQPRERLAESLSVADVHIVSLIPELEGLIVPSKVYGIAAAGRPIVYIGDPDGEIPRVLKAFDLGVTVRPGDAAGLARVLTDLAADPERGRAMGRRARALFEQRYDQPHAIAAWQDLLATLP